jgi:hypothetical protein
MAISLGNSRAPNGVGKTLAASPYMNWTGERTEELNYMISNIHTLGVLAMALGGCSLTMRGAVPYWDKREEPKCSQNYTPIYIDGLIANVNASLALDVVLNNEYSPSVKEHVGGVTAAIAFLFTVSALVGSSRYQSCRKARAAWATSEVLRERTAEAARGEQTGSGKQIGSNHAAVAPPAKTNEGTPGKRSPSKASAWAIEPATATSGHFCASSVERFESSICMRDHAACELAREALSLPNCMPRKVAWCFDLDGSPQCFGTSQACQAQLATAAAESTPCTETL